LTLLVGWQEGHLACKKTEWWGVGVVICLERCADLHMAQLMPLPLTVSCFSKIQTGFSFLVPAHLGSAGQRAVKWVCVYLYRPNALPVTQPALQSRKVNSTDANFENHPRDNRDSPIYASSPTENMATFYLKTLETHTTCGN